jgi:hypothetical protein
MPRIDCLRGNQPMPGIQWRQILGFERLAATWGVLTSRVWELDLWWFFLQKTGRFDHLGRGRAPATFRSSWLRAYCSYHSLGVPDGNGGKAACAGRVERKIFGDGLYWIGFMNMSWNTSSTSRVLVKSGCFGQDVSSMAQMLWAQQWAGKLWVRACLGYVRMHERVTMLFLPVAFLWHNIEGARF